ncbi:C4-dicarboxylate ABC transporter, partial [Amylibacter sp.]|nr:C4-dicarboxylate ABC transporter [Amylibacter sp.]
QSVAVEYRDHIASVAMDRAASSLDAYIAGGGTVVEMSDDARKAWADSMPNIAVDWAKQLDSTGAPGSEMLVAYMNKLKAAGMTPIRDWAAELN